jgi:murein DD-endopeptidase MepM/ murein hydrolase activator NlpD
MFHPAVPITMDTVAGNTITLDVGSGQFAYYCHLQPGSLQVKPGDHVRRGQFLARVGASGDARELHRHIEVTTDPHFVAGDGVPYLIDRYRLVGGDDHVTTLRAHELPLNGMVVDFGRGRTK